MAFVECNGRVLCYRDSGEAGLPAVLFAHPLGMSQAVWSDVIEALRGRYRCISWDLPGHGASAPVDAAIDASDLGRDALALLDHLDIERCHFVGTSIGGVIGQALLLDAADRLQNVVLTNTGAVIGTPDAWNERAERVRREGLAAIAAELSQRWFADAYKRDAAAAVKGWTTQLARTDDESYARLCELLGATDFRGRLDGVDSPVQLVAGAEDPATPPDTLAALGQEIPAASLDTINAVAHVPSVEAPGEFAARLPGWLGSSEAAASAPVTYDEGLATRKSVLGSEHVERASQSATTLDAPFQALITRFAWGELWSNPDLSRTQRSLVTIAVLAALGRDGELVLHLKTAKRIGVTEAQLRQSLMHVAVYAGVPASNHAFKLAKEQGWGDTL
jgi:3-oxoadipate enol-lactonase/4-carboxymuconolactone decarboxylase